MVDVVVGIDPDTDKHGVAVYTNGRLSELSQLALVDIIDEILKPFQENPPKSLTFSIEDVCSQNFVYSRNVTGRRGVDQNIARSVGACQQAQRELMRVLEYYDVPYKLHKPSSSNFAKHKPRFQKLTGWTGRSNEDTRSAAYFGFLEVKR